MRGFILVTAALFIVGCESDFDKCMDANFAKLTEELPEVPTKFSDLDWEVQRSIHNKINVTEEAKALDKARFLLMVKHCGPFTDDPFPGKDPDCQALVDDWLPKDQVIERMREKAFEQALESYRQLTQNRNNQARTHAKTDAAEICNSQGIYE